MKVTGRKAITAVLIIAAVAVSVAMVACSVDDDVDNALPTGVSSSDKGSLTLTATKRTLTADEVDSTGLLAVLKDNNGRGIAAVPILFTTDMPDLRFEPEGGTVTEPASALSKAVCGSLSCETYTDSGGRASVRLIAGTTPGSASVFANAPEAFNLFPAQVLIKLTDVGAAPSEGPLTITPTDVTFASATGGEAADFFAFGGTPPYDWFNTFPGCGSLTEIIPGSNPSRHDRFRYTVAPGFAGQCEDVVIVRDAGGEVAEASVSIETPSPLQVSAGSLTLDAGDVGDQTPESTTLTAVGGVPSYTWSIVSGDTFADFGGSNTAVGQTVILTSKQNGDDFADTGATVVEVADSRTPFPETESITITIVNH
jgi:hypothetical protein